MIKMLSFSSVYQNRLAFFLCVLERNRKISLTLCSTFMIIFVLICISPIVPKGHIIIISATYYNTSTLYPSHTVAILFNAPKNMSEDQKWTCKSKNSAGIIWLSDISPQKAYEEIPNCQWTTFIGNCTTIQNPISLQISVENDGNKGVEIPLRFAVREKLPLVACFSPLFFNERWQLIILSIESYAAAGISRQAYYFMSAIKNVYDLLQFYEDQKIIDINLWTLPRHSEARIQLDWRNQGAAHSDCFLKYREAADFIIISDIDDILFPRRNFNLIKELQFYSFMHPNISSFFFPRFDAKIQTSTSYANFDIKKSIESVTISNRLVTGKSVHKTALVETVWIHWAGLIKDKRYFKQMNMTENAFVHVRNWNFNETYSNISSKNSNPYANFLFPNITSIIPQHFISHLADRFNCRFNSTKHKFQTLPSVEVYYEKINKCYDEMQESIKEHYKHHKEPAPLCPTPSRCKFRSIPNLPCVITVSSYQAVQLTKTFTVEYLKTLQKVSIRKNGCQIN